MIFLINEYCKNAWLADYFNILLNIAIIILVIELVLSLLFYFLQDFFFFRPEILPHNFKYRYPFPFDEVNFDMEDGGTINGIHFKVPNAKGVVFISKAIQEVLKVGESLPVIL